MGSPRRRRLARIARESQGTRFHTTSLHNLSGNISKVNETSLTVGGLLVYGIGRLTDSRLVSDVALHATESVVLASLASQVIRGPLGRARPCHHRRAKMEFARNPSTECRGACRPYR